jgi:hypothetical protein
MNDDSRLVALALGTFHAVLFTLALVLLLYLTIDLGEALDGLNTLAGLAIFGALWTTSVYCTHRGMHDAGLEPGSAAAAGPVLRSGESWGAWNGVLFFWCLLAAGLVLVAVAAIGHSGEQSSGGFGFTTGDGQGFESTFREEGDASASRVFEVVTSVLAVGITAFGVGTILSALVGAFFGFVFALLDLTLLWAASFVTGREGAANQRVRAS